MVKNLKPSSSANPLFSIVLPTFNRLHSLRKILLPSIERQSFQNYEFIVIDDCSTDQTEKYFTGKELARDFPQLSAHVRYFRNSHNSGSPTSRNNGFDKARGQWIYMTEDDLEVRDSEFLAKAAELVKKLVSQDPKIAVICPKREEFIAGYFHNPPHNFIRYGRLSGELYLDPAQEYSGYIPNAQACSFFLADLARKFRYDTASFKYFREESDFYARIVEAGYKIYYVGDILRSYHRMDLSTAGGNRKHSNSLKNEYKYISSQYAFLKKHSHFPQIKIIFFVLVRGLKHFANLSHLSFIKDSLSYAQV